MIVKSSIQKTCDPRPEKGNRRCLCVPTAEDVYRHSFIYMWYITALNIGKLQKDQTIIHSLCGTVQT